ncbi:MAG: hypothetical protein K9N21_04410 [Deltaproteobacteria bacterium]|nr:hypothetical protein [Deltaproteobacteria bacterium]
MFFVRIKSTKYTQHNLSNNISTTRDTFEFAVDSMRTWWSRAGSNHYPNADRLLILADCGGSNGYRTRMWKHQLHMGFCNRFGLQVKVCHYPPGSSKWNPIEYRMFSFISSNWVALALRDDETVLRLESERRCHDIPPY